MLPQRQIAMAIARSTLDQRRSCMRIRLAAPAEVTCPVHDPQHHRALIRDISTSGAFLYSNFTPEMNSDVTLDFLFPIVEKRMRIACSGTVVRVEKSMNGGATGIAIKFQHCDMMVIC
jgi:c-di-GMP-binding flagellar brake protein YcgR